MWNHLPHAAPVGTIVLRFTVPHRCTAPLAVDFEGQDFGCFEPCRTFVKVLRVWFSCSGFEPSVVLITWYSSVIRGKAGLCVPCSCPTSWLRCWSGSNMVAPLLTMCFLVAYAFMTISCFTLTWLRSPAWRPAGIHRIVESFRLSTVSESVGRLLGLLPCHVVCGISVLGLVMCLVATVILMMVSLLMCLLLLYA